MIECKNHREWFYPSHGEMKVLVRKALAAEMTPILIARRIAYYQGNAVRARWHHRS